MNPSKLFLAICFLASSVLVNAQQTTTETEKSSKKKNKTNKTTKVEKKTETSTETLDIDVEDDKDDNKKMKITINGKKVDLDGKNKSETTTIIVDGDNVKIDGKDVSKMNEQELEALKNKSEKLKFISPYLNKKMKISIDGMPKELAEIFSNVDGMHYNNWAESYPMPMNKALLGVVTDTEDDDKGAKITSVTKESAAEICGLKVDDVITKINEEKISSSKDLTKAIGKFKPEEKVLITFLHNGKEQKTEATLKKNKEADYQVYTLNGDEMMRNYSGDRNELFKYNGREFDENYFDENFSSDSILNLKLKKLITGINKPRIGAKVQDLEDGDGVNILEVEENTPAAKAGLKKDDIIVEVEGVVLKGVDDLRKKMKDIKEGEVYNVTYKRNGSLQKTQVKFPKKLKTADL